jgi:enoyl-CoA hydratase
MIELEERGVVTILRMAAGKGNALNLEFTQALAEAIERVERSSARAAVLTGEGGTFSAGVDLPALISGGPDYVRRFVPVMVAGFERLVLFPKPLVAAVNGHAIAGGAIMLFACDQRILARGKARVGLTEIRVGVEFPSWALEVARFLTPPEHLSTLILTGRTWPPDEALARGLVDEVVEPDALLDRACEVAAELAAIPAACYAANKKLLRQPLVERARQLTAAHGPALVEKWCSPETLKDVADFASRHIGRRA